MYSFRPAAVLQLLPLLSRTETAPLQLLCGAVALLISAGCSESDDEPVDGSGGSTMSGTASGGGSLDGSSGMAGSMTAGMGSEPCPASAVFCENFDDDAVGVAPGAPWSLSINGNGSITVDTTHAVGGGNAALVSIPGGSDFQRAYMGLDGNSDAFPAVATEMFGRAMMWLNATPDGDVHWTFIQGQGASGENDGTNRLYRYGGQHQEGAGLMANYETTGISTDCWEHSTATMPTEQWACVEWRFATATNEMELWLDGVNIEDIHVTQRGEGCVGQDLQGDWLAPPAFEQLFLGWERYQTAGNDRNLWIDDIALSTERIGCAQ